VFFAHGARNVGSFCQDMCTFSKSIKIIGNGGNYIIKNFTICGLLLINDKMGGILCRRNKKYIQHFGCTLN
jgi:hypothetical protein